MEVVEGEDQRHPCSEALKQRPDRAVGAVALGLEVGARRVAAREIGERGEHRGDLRTAFSAEPLQLARVEGAEVVVERVHEHAERKLLLELGAAPGEDEVRAPVGGVG